MASWMILDKYPLFYKFKSPSTLEWFLNFVKQLGVFIPNHPQSNVITSTNPPYKYNSAAVNIRNNGERLSWVDIWSEAALYEHSWVALTDLIFYGNFVC